MIFDEAQFDARYLRKFFKTNFEIILFL